MGRKLFVGGIPYEMTEDRFREIFSEFGPVQYAKIILDQETGKSRGFGFLEYETADEASAAVDGLSGKKIDGRFLTVREAVERRPNPKPRSDRWRSPEPEIRTRPGNVESVKKVRKNRRRKVRSDSFDGPEYG